MRLLTDALDFVIPAFAMAMAREVSIPRVDPCRILRIFSVLGRAFVIRRGERGPS